MKRFFSILGICLLSSGAYAAFWNENVGIGTSTPTEKLEVVGGNIKAAGVITTAPGTTLNGIPYTWPALQGGAATCLQNDGTGVLTWASCTSGAGFVTGSGSAGRLAIWNTSSDLTSDATLFWDTTNKRLQVGTTAPAVRLQISGTGGVNSTFRISKTDATTNDWDIGFLASNANIILQPTSDASFKIRDATGATDQFSVSSASGNTVINGNLTAFGSAPTFGTAGTSLTVTVGQGTTGTDSSTLKIRSGNSGTTAPALLLTRNTTDEIQLTFDGTNSFMDYTGSYNWRSGIGGTTEATLSSGGNFDAIGSTHFFGTAGTATTLTVGQGTTGTDAATLKVQSGNNTTTAPSIVLRRNTTDLAQLTTDGTDTFFDYTGTRKWRSGIAGTQRMQLTSGGNLSVGSTTSTSMLNIGSSAQLQVDSSGNLVKINNVTYSWPGTQGGASTVLTNDGSGNLTWSASSGTTFSPNTTTEIFDDFLNGNGVATATPTGGVGEHNHSILGDASNACQQTVGSFATNPDTNTPGVVLVQSQITANRGCSLTNRTGVATGTVFTGVNRTGWFYQTRLTRGEADSSIFTHFFGLDGTVNNFNGQSKIGIIYRHGSNLTACTAANNPFSCCTGNATGTCNDTDYICIVCDGTGTPACAETDTTVPPSAAGTYDVLKVEMNSATQVKCTVNGTAVTTTNASHIPVNTTTYFYVDGVRIDTTTQHSIKVDYIWYKDTGLSR